MDKLVKALIKARKDINNPHFDSENPHFQNKFASLKAVLEAIIPALTENGVFFAQDFVTEDGRCVCRTHLVHESGESIVFMSPPMQPVKGDPQGWASASTYARRYGALAAAGIVGEPDDDGNAASAGKRKEMPMKQARKIADLLDAADPENGEGVDAFGECWLELDQDEQLGFGKHFSNFYPGAVSAQKQKMRDVIAAYRNRMNGES